MVIAGALDADKTLNALAALRPDFHSEADSPFTSAWQIQSAPTHCFECGWRPGQHRMSLST